MDKTMDNAHSDKPTDKMKEKAIGFLQLIINGKIEKATEHLAIG